MVLSAELRKEDNQFNGVNVVSDDDQLSFLVFNQGGDVVKTVLEDDGLLGVNLLVVLLGFSSSDQSLLLFSGLFRSVRGQKLQQVSRVILVEGLGELVNLGRNFKSLEENSFLSLKSNVSGPSDESGEVSLGLDITTNSEGSGLRFEQGVLLLFNLLGLGNLLRSFRHL